MRPPTIPPLILLALAAAIYLLPEGATASWRRSLQGAIANLIAPTDPEAANLAIVNQDINQELLLRLEQKDAELAQARQRLAAHELTMAAMPNIEIIPARLINLGSHAETGSFTIDAGHKSGVKPGDAVAVGSTLVGVVVQTSLSASLVLSLSSPGCYISARVGPAEAGSTPREVCAVSGDGVGGVKAVAFGSSTSIAPGWLALSSGLEKSIPEGLILGTISGSFTDGSESGTVEAALTPQADFKTLDYVSVLRRK